MPSDNITLTAQERQELIKELEWREHEEHDRIVADIREARAQGDLSENAEFDAAKEDQAKNESRIQEIRYILENGRIIESNDSTEVSIGCTVELEDAKGKKLSFTIVSTTGTNSLEHKISSESPAGTALTGKRVGDTVTFSTPSGRVREYTITGITR